MKLVEWVFVLGKAMFVGLLWGGLYFVVDEFFHPSESTKIAVAAGGVVLWFFWAVSIRKK